MKTYLRLMLASALVITCGPATAGELRLSMADGRVTLIAKDVTVREILAEWARVGQTRIVNGDKLSGGPVTLQLENIPEAQALDTILRAAAGYVMAARTPGSPGASVYDRIMILASSRPPAVTANAPAPFANRPAAQQMPQNQPQDDEGEAAMPAGGNNMMNSPAMPQPGVGVLPQYNQQPAQLQVFPQPPPQAQPQPPMTAPRPGMLPPPPPAPAPANVNPFLGTPPGPTAPGYSPVPPPPVAPPRQPGGPGGA
jgi:hypothetical protein